MKLFSFSKQLLKRQIWLAMKLTIVLMTAAFLQVSATGNSQTVNFSGKDVSLKKVFSVIKNQTGHVFFYDIDLLRESKPVTIDLKNVPLETALKEIFKKQPLTWLIENKTITIVKKQVPVSGTPTFIVAELPPPIKVKGTVTEANGKGLPGVSVTVKGTQTVTITDNSGNFSIEADNGQVLVVSSVGFSTRLIKVEGPELNIKLQEYVEPLEDLVVSGNLVATKRKADISSVTVLNSKTLAALPFQSVDQVFRGNVPGLNNFEGAYETPGYPDPLGGISVHLRGASGVGKVFIDGLEMAGGVQLLYNIDKNTIDRIEVVRGPAAATLYGTGSNGGVILIFTKNAQKKTTTFNASTALGWYDSKLRVSNPMRTLTTLDFTQAGKSGFSYALGAVYEYRPTYEKWGYTKPFNLNGKVNYKTDKWNISLAARRVIRTSEPERNSYYDTVTRWVPPAMRRPDSLKTHGDLKMLTANIQFKAFPWWTHELTAGYSISEESWKTYAKLKENVANYAYSALYTFKQPNIRYTNTLKFGKDDAVLKASLLTGFEYSRSIYDGSRETVWAGHIKLEGRGNNQKTAGYFAQFNPTLFNKIFFTIAGRYDVNENFGQYFTPRVGVTTNFNWKGFTFKPRLAYGAGTTPPSYEQRFGDNQINLQYGYTFIANPDLKPTEQRGGEGALEVYSNDGRFQFEVTHYRSTTMNSIGSRFLSPNPPPYDTLNGGTTAVYQYYNTGKFKNNGWEFSASYNYKNFSIRGTYSVTKSTLKEPASPLNPARDFPLIGEQFPGYATKTAGGTISYSFPKLFGKADKLTVALNGTYFGGFIGQDNAGYLMHFFQTGTWPQLSRSSWINFPSVAKFNADVTYDFDNRFSMFAQIRNIGNRFRPENGSSAYTIGRGWLFGIKYSFIKVKQ